MRRRSIHGIFGLQHVLLSLLLFTLAFDVLGCTTRSGITKEEVLRISRVQLSKIGIDLKTHDVEVFPDHPITVDSIKSGAVRTSWAETYSKWLHRTNDRLDGKLFWMCRCGPNYDATDGITELFVDAQNGKVLHVDGWTGQWIPSDDK